MKIIAAKHPSQYDEAVAVATDFLQNGGTVVMPMDTSYGIAADATDPAAVQSVFALKGRPKGMPLSVVVRDREQAENMAHFSAEAARIWQAFMPGHLTLVLPLADGSGLAEGVTAGGRSIGLRHPDNPLTTLLSERFGRPYTATSANLSGRYPPAYTADEFIRTLPEDAAPHAVIDGGELPMTPPSTVVSLVNGFEVLREGALSGAEIRQVLE